MENDFSLGENILGLEVIEPLIGFGYLKVFLLLVVLEIMNLLSKRISLEY